MTTQFSPQTPDSQQKPNLQDEQTGNQTDSQADNQTNSQDVDKLATFLRLMRYLKPYWWAFIFVIIGFAISAGAEVGSAKLFEFIIDAINEDDRHRKFWFPFLVILLFVFRGVGAFLGSYYSALMARSLVYVLRIEVFENCSDYRANFS
ncbi:Lipid A export ATP-binding/permease protein MsbA [Moraxella caviae]|uniref:hypothetical protein n=1 Tax=Moraxella caviae TaxID=34060 RepID=UPI00101B40FD|nr:hypothetical protein [Moraxella caviae]VEW13183.1 Lipid A export ATP-binding/permease protein MsbA [Moraxella caviae]